MAATEQELTPEQLEACAEMGAALNRLLETFAKVQATGLDPMAVVASSIPPEALAELPLPLRMMLG